jgi:hypothetical protein
MLLTEQEVQTGGCQSSFCLYMDQAVSEAEQEKRIIFLHGSTTWRQKFSADQRSIFVLNLHMHKHIVF